MEKHERHLWSQATSWLKINESVPGAIKTQSQNRKPKEQKQPPRRIIAKGDHEATLGQQALCGVTGLLPAILTLKKAQRYNEFYFRRVKQYEKNISTKQQKTKKNSWVHGAHEHQGGPKGSIKKAQKTARYAVRVGTAVVRRDLRLRRGELFAKAYREGKSIPAKQVVLYFLDTGSGDPTRVGFSISKKIGNAVVRNKTKRRLKSILGSLADELREGHILVFVGRTAVTDCSFAELSAVVRRLLERATILGGNR